MLELLPSGKSKRMLIHSHKFLLAILFIVSIPFVSNAQKQKLSAVYYPEAGEWTTKQPNEVGVDPDVLKQAIDFVKQKESTSPRDLEQAHYQTFGREPFGEAIGPFRERGEPTGIVIKGGYVVATWGDPSRVEMTFSVTKSLLSSVVGVAVDKGIIKSVHDTVYKAIGPIQIYKPLSTESKGDQFGNGSLVELFNTPHNKKITWDHLLRQTSDWEGTLWGKPEWADRPSNNPSEWRTRARDTPGTVYEYNDVRVNVLALAALNVWRRPLPQVLKENIMDPIGASSSWRWLGYDNSWIVLDGVPVQAVGGGGHWGGGMFINANDMARFGYLTLRRGKWKNIQVLSESWVNMALTPTPAEPTYGFMNWFLNTNKKFLSNAPATAFVHIGNGTNMVYVDPEHDLVVVARWIENSAMNEFIGKVLQAVNK
jgi:CubicO group peptidase (beta-lactamase class C family)